MSKRHQQTRRPAEGTKPAEAPPVEEARPAAPETGPAIDPAVAAESPSPPTASATEPEITVQVSAPVPPDQVMKRLADAEPLDRNGNVECEALQGVMHLGQFMPPGSKFSLERQLFRRLKKVGHVRGHRQD